MSEASRSEFEAAIAAARETPEQEETWDQVEALAGELDSPDDVADLYREVLGRELSPELADQIGERAASFFEEWFGDDPTGLAAVLSRVLELNSDADWAFQRLTLALTEAQRWDQLLSVYDSVIARTDDLGRQVELLEEASQVARDMADDSDKAIAYLTQLLPLKPEDDKLAPALERLLEKHERWADLIELWRTLLDDQTQEERAATLGRIAACYLDHLGAAPQALEAAKEFLSEADDDREPCALIERIFAFEGATPEVRTGALDLLRYQYESTDRPMEFVRVLESAIEVAPEKEKDYRSEAAEILAELDQLEAAMNHYAALLALDSSSAATLGHLRQLAQRSGNYELFAQGVRRAAEAAPDPSRRVALLSAAAKTRLTELGDQDGAIEMFLQALRTEDIAPADILAVGRKLNELLAQSDRNQERLEVLERLAAAETVESTRKALMGDIARLSDRLGDSDRALAAWRARLDLDSDDDVALDATITLLGREQKWEELVAALQRRVDGAASPDARKADLVQIARIYRDKLDAVDQALASWTQVQSEFGETEETVTALTQLLSSAGQWEELAELLERASAGQSSALLDRLALLGNAYRDHLDAPGRALDCYDRILRIDPYHEGAGQGLQGLLEVEACAAKAVDILATTYRNTANWRGILSLADARLRQTDDRDKQLGILREAARIHEDEANDAHSALAALAKAFPLAPRDQVLERDMVRLAEDTGTWDVAVASYRAALEAVAGNDNAVGELNGRLAAILDERVGDASEALACYQLVASLEPANHPAVSAITRLAAGLGRWADAARTVVRYTRVRDRIDPALIGTLEAKADQRDEWSQLVEALADAVDADTELGSLHAAQLFATIASWQATALDDAAGRQESLIKVLRHEPNRIEALRDLAELRRVNPSATLYETLRRIAELEPNNLDVRWEAAEVAVAHLRDEDEVERALSSLMTRAAGAWRGTAPASCERDPRQAVEWSMAELGRRFTESGRAAASFELFVDAARLPFPAETQRSLRVRAATVASNELGDPSSAIEMYRSVLSQAPDDREALEQLGELYRKQNRHAELLSLCQHELSLGADAGRKLELRLEIARLVGEVERQGDRVSALKRNLQECPGHEASVTALTEILTAQGAYADLIDVIQNQAGQLESEDETARAAQLWTQAAHLAENELGDARRAIEAHRRVVALTPELDSYDALARLYTERGEPEQAVPWLERLLTATQDERSPLVMRLANAHVAAGDDASAIEVVRKARADGDRTAEVRGLLADLYRRAKSWRPLADLYMASVKETSGATARDYARKAADLYHHKLADAERTLAAAESAIALELELSESAEIRDLKVMKAQALRSTGQTQAARLLLEELIEEFGRRRSKDRAAIHVELAYVLQSEGDHDRALKEVELASKMDAGNPQLLRKVAALANDAGKPEKAEKSLRSLLLVVRRHPPGDELDAVGESEVLYELHRIAASRDEAEKADELLASALEAALQSDAEVARLCRTVIACGEYDIALKAMEQRLDASDDANSKAELLTGIADILETHKGRSEDGLRRRLEALALAPERLDLHDRAAAAAKAADAVATYVSKVADLTEGMKRDVDAELSGTLWMRLGKLAENDLEDLTKARDYYGRAEATATDRAGALFALARVANAIGDTTEATRALDELTEMAEGQEASPAQAGALYRLAEMQVGSDELRARGIEMLRRALKVDSKPTQAARILRAAAEAEPGNADILALYERVARASGEWEILLDFLERRARLADATPDQIREAVDLANTHGQQARGEALLERAVDAARSSDEGLSSAIWAAVALCRQKMRDDLRAARHLVYEIADLASAAEVFAVCSEIAETASQRDDLELAAEMLELLRQREPSRRDVWEPLSDIYRRIGDRNRFMGVIMSTLPTLVDPLERNALRKQTARYLIDADSAEEALDPLRDALLDDPDDIEAAGMLEQVLRSTGNDEGLADFLWQRFEDAKERGNPDTMEDVAVRLGSLLDSMGSADVLTVYQTALSVAPSSRVLLHRVIDALPEGSEREQADLMERLLAVETEDEVADLALRLADVWMALSDMDGVLRALRIGHRRASTDARLRARLESFYREAGMWQELAEMMVAEAEAIEDVRLAVGRLREAASLYRDYLMNPGRAGAVLRKAQERSPEDAGLVLELVDCLGSAGDTAGAARAVADALASGVDGRARVDLLLTQAHLSGELGDQDGAIAALEEAFRLDAERAEEPLKIALERQRAVSSQSGDREGERSATMKLAELLAASGSTDQASDLLIGWAVNEPQDVEALEQLRDLDTSAQRWHGVVTACSRLVMVQHGEAQIDAANRLAHAAKAMGDVGQARQGLEFVQQVQPENGQIRDHLRSLYESTSALHELATLLLSDAEHAADDEQRYQAYRRAADIMINQLGDAAAAIPAAQKAQEIKPDDHETMVLLADVLTHSGRADEAAAMLEPAIADHKRRSPELAELQHRMARIAQVYGDQQTQLAWLKKAFDVDRKNGFIAAELAQLATELQDYDLALKPLRAISLMDTPGPISRTMALLWEAKIEHARGNRAKAELWAKKALREDPEFMEAQEFLSQIQE